MENIEHPVDPFMGEITFIVPSQLEFERITDRKNYTQLWSSSNQLTGSDNFRLSENDRNNHLISESANEFHQIVNYLWISAVFTLLVTSLIFLIFSVYFYRKFMEWKKCNKDIQSQLNQNHSYGKDDQYYSAESLPCYTIASGLPTYSEALKMYPVQDERQGFLKISFAKVHPSELHIKQFCPEYPLSVIKDEKGMKRTFGVRISQISTFVLERIRQNREKSKRTKVQSAKVQSSLNQSLDDELDEVTVLS